MTTIFNYNAPSDLLKDRVILVTGAGSGIGQAAAMAFGSCGAEVILSGSNTARLEQTYDLMLAGGCREPTLYTFDLRCADEQPYLEFADAVRSEFGHLNGLLHNASLLGEIKPIAQQTFQTWCDFATGLTEVDGQTISQSPTTSATPIRLNWRCKFEDGSAVVASFTAKGEEKALIAIEHSKLKLESHITDKKHAWAGLLSACFKG